MCVSSFFHASVSKRFHCTVAPCFTFFQLLSNDQGRSSLNACFPNFFHTVTHMEIIVVSLRKTGGDTQKTAGLGAVAVPSPPGHTLARRSLSCGPCDH